MQRACSPFSWRCEKGKRTGTRSENGLGRCPQNAGRANPTLSNPPLWFCLFRAFVFSCFRDPLSRPAFHCVQPSERKRVEDRFPFVSRKHEKANKQARRTPVGFVGASWAQNRSPCSRCARAWHPQSVTRNPTRLDSPILTRTGRLRKLPSRAGGGSGRCRAWSRIRSAGQGTSGP